MTIHFTKHALLRIRERKYTKNHIISVVNTSKYLFFDTKTKSYVAIAQIEYGNVFRYIAVFFHLDTDNNKVIHTFHPETIVEMQNRVAKGRYLKVI